MRDLGALTAETLKTFSTSPWIWLVEGVLELTTAARKKVLAIWLDFNNLTQNMNMRLSYKIDGVNYRAFWTDTWETTEEDGALINVPRAITNDLKLELQSDALEGAARDIPYSLIYQDME